MCAYRLISQFHRYYWTIATIVSKGEQFSSLEKTSGVLMVTSWSKRKTENQIAQFSILWVSLSLRCFCYPCHSYSQTVQRTYRGQPNNVQNNLNSERIWQNKVLVLSLADSPSLALDCSPCALKAYMFLKVCMFVCRTNYLLVFNLRSLNMA